MNLGYPLSCGPCPPWLCASPPYRVYQRQEREESETRCGRPSKQEMQRAAERQRETSNRLCSLSKWTSKRAGMELTYRREITIPWSAVVLMHDRCLP